MKAPLLTSLAIASCLVFSAAGCGGGGGNGDNFYGAAKVSVTAKPTRIDTGDRTQVKMELSEIHENGIAVKIRFPSGLVYVPGSSFLEVGPKEIDVDPKIITSDSSQEVSYVVIFLSQDQFRRSSDPYQGESGTLRIELVGRKAVFDGEIEVDPDVNDLAVDDAVEFDVKNPNFVAEGSASIQVVSQ